MHLHTYMVEVKKMINSCFIILSRQVLTGNDWSDASDLIWTDVPDVQIYYSTVIIWFDKFVEFALYVRSRFAVQEDWPCASQKHIRPSTDQCAADNTHYRVKENPA